MKCLLIIPPVPAGAAWPCDQQYQMETALAIWPRSCAIFQVGIRTSARQFEFSKSRIGHRFGAGCTYIGVGGGDALKEITMSWAKKSWAIATRKSPASVTTEAAALCMGENHRYQDWAHLFERLLDCRQQYDIHGSASLATPHQLHLAAM